MDDTSEDQLEETGKLKVPQKKQTSAHQNKLAPSAGAKDFDAMTASNLPYVEMWRMSDSVKLRVPMMLPPSWTASVSDWVTEQPTWVLPAMPNPAKASKQDSSSATQGSVAQDKRVSSGAQGRVAGEKQASSGTQGYLALAIDMVKSSGIYALGALASPLVSLILTPFLAHHLSPTDYGALSLLYTIVDLVTLLTQLGVGSAFFRAYNSDFESPDDRFGVLATTITLLSLVSIPIAIVMMLVAPWLSEHLLGTPSFSDSVRLTALVIVLENLTLPGISWLRAEKRVVLYSALSVANLLAILGTNLLLIGKLHFSLDGALIAKGAGFAVIVAYTMPAMLFSLVRNRKLRFRFDIVWSMLSFGIPTVFSDIAAWVLQLSDRYLLGYFGSLAQTASYSVAYVLGGVLSPVMLAPWGLAWVPVMYSIAKRDDAAHIFKLVFRWWSTALLFATFALSILSSAVLKVLFPPSYYASQPVIPMVSLSTMLIGVSYIFMIGVNIRRKTILDFLYTLMAALANLLLNLFLIPHFGAMGAAVSTLAAYGLLTAVVYIVNQKIYPIPFEIGSFLFKLSAGIILYVGSSVLVHGQELWISWSVSVVALIIYGIFLLWFEGLSVKKLMGMVSYVQVALKQVVLKKVRKKDHE
jgi:O-antigen/teichoic acid export membrane protein